MVGCSIRNCKSRSVKGGTVMFFSFPVKESVANEWLRHCGPKTTTKNGRVCSNHFLSSDYFKSLQHILLNESPRKVRKLKPDALPTLHINDVDKKKHGNTSNIKSIPEFNKTPANEVMGPSNVVDESDENIMIPLVESLKKTNSVERQKEVISQIQGTSSNIESIPDFNKTPTDEDAEDAGPSNVVDESDKNIMIPLSEYKSLKRTFNEFHILKENMEKIFTPGQIRCFMKEDMHRVRWSEEDIAAAFSLRSISAKGYHHLRTTLGIPLPGLSTLRKWASKFQIKEEL